MSVAKLASFLGRAWTKVWHESSSINPAVPGPGEGLVPPFSSREARCGGLALLRPGAASFIGV